MMNSICYIYYILYKATFFRSKKKNTYTSIYYISLTNNASVFNGSIRGLLRFGIGLFELEL
jgi:hypothetical protein